MTRVGSQHHFKKKNNLTRFLFYVILMQMVLSYMLFPHLCVATD